MLNIDILSRQKDLGKTQYYHEILTKGADLEFSKRRVLRFFQKYKLINYSNVSVLEKESLPASSPEFEERLKEAILTNRQLLRNLIKELQDEGITTIQNLQAIQQGYKTRVFHVITHLLDGKFGLDTHFYNLEEDSHWVSEELWEKIKNDTSHYWLLSIEAKI